MAKRAKKKVAKGKRLTKGRGWKLEDTKGKKRSFVATLLGTHNFGQVRIAIFSVPKKFKG